MRIGKRVNTAIDSAERCWRVLADRYPLAVHWSLPLLAALAVSPWLPVATAAIAAATIASWAMWATMSRRLRQAEAELVNALREAGSLRQQINELEYKLHHGSLSTMRLFSLPDGDDQ